MPQGWATADPVAVPPGEHVRWEGTMKLTLVRRRALGGLVVAGALSFAPALAGCDKGPRPAPAAPPTARAPVEILSTSAASASAPIASAPTPSVASAAPVPPARLAPPARLVAIGDLHGDLAATRAVL